jgi:CDP-6-deoxy-D-xylo-4-hexulose-3-dehydrase
MSEIKKDINIFINSLKEKYNKNIPQFCHNLNTLENKVYYGGPFFDDSEIVAAIETLLFGKWGSGGEKCAEFEREFSKKINQKFSIFCNSGSSANLLLIAACKEYFKWENNDCIAVSAVGFPTTTSSIIHNGLKPIFVDIEWNTLNFNLDELEQKIIQNNKIKGIFISPVLGNPPDFDKLLEMSEKYNVKLLLDNCDSLGSKWNGKYLNEYCVASSCSFYPAHEITTLEGGMVSSNYEEIVKIARSFSSWGRSCYCVGSCNLLPNGVCNKRFSNWIPQFPTLTLDHKYVFERIGWNLKPLDLQAAIGIEQLKKLNYICESRKNNCNKIQEIFKIIDGIKFPKILPFTDWVPFGTPIICANKEQKNKLVIFLERNGIQTRNYFAGNLLIHPGYNHLDDYLKYPESNKVLDLIFFVGAAPTISSKNLEHIKNVINEFVKQ